MTRAAGARRARRRPRLRRCRPPGRRPDLHPPQRARRGRGHQRPRRARLPPHLPRQGHAHPLQRLPAPALLQRRVRPPHRGRDAGLQREPRARAGDHPGRVRLRPPGALLQGRAGADAAHARHRASASASATPSTRGRTSSAACSTCASCSTCSAGDVILAAAGLQRGRERRPPLQRRAALPRDPGLRGQDPGPPRRRGERARGHDLVRPGPALSSGRPNADRRPRPSRRSRPPAGAAKAPARARPSPSRSTSTSGRTPRASCTWRRPRPPTASTYTTIRALD